MLAITILVMLVVTWHSIYLTRSLWRKALERQLRDLAQVASFEMASGEQPFPGSLIQIRCREYAMRTDARCMVLDGGGRVVADSSAPGTSAPEGFAQAPEVVKALGGTTSVGYPNSSEGRMVRVAAPLRQDGRIVGVLLVSRTVALPKGHEPAFYSLLGFGVMAALCIALGLSAVVSHYVARPLQELERGTARLADGDLDSPLPFFHAAEIDRVAKGINTMAGQVASRLAAVKGDHHELEAIVSSMMEGVMAIDTEQCVFKANQAAMDMLRVSREALMGRPLGSVIRNATLEDLVSRTLTSEEPVEGEATFYGDEDRTVSIHGTQLLSSEGAKVGAVVVLNDITRLRRLETMRRQFASNVSHELKTPITSIQGFVETLLDGTLEDSPEDVRHFLEIILKQTRRLNAIMEDILLLSRIEQGRAELTKGLERLTVDRAVRGALEQCRKKAAEKNISLLAECPENILIEAHPRLIEQAIVNLLTNAINYSPDGATVTVRVDRGEKDIMVHVIDDGCGISRDHLPRLFERFYRVDKARSRQLGGTGLGLAIVKHIAQVHCGTVSVDSTLGKGSTFTLTIPITRPATP